MLYMSLYDYRRFSSIVLRQGFPQNSSEADPKSNLDEIIFAFRRRDLEIAYAGLMSQGIRNQSRFKLEFKWDD